MKPIYIPVSINEPPKDESRYGAVLKSGIVISDWFNGKSFTGDNSKNITHWLKPITSLSELPEEWKKEIREIAGRSFDAGDNWRYGRMTKESPHPNKQEHLQTILP